MDEQKRRGSISRTCSGSLLNTSSSQSRCGTQENEKQGDVEVDQKLAGKNLPEETIGLKEAIEQNNILEIESVAESLGVVDISNTRKGEVPKIKRNKWKMRKVGKKA